VSIDIVPLKADMFAIRFHRRRWLKIQAASAERHQTSGWRPIAWTEDFTEAEKFASQEVAESFAGAYIPGFRQNSQLTSTAATA